MSETAHNGHVEPMTTEEFAGYLAARFHDWSASGRFADEEAVKTKVNEEAETFDADGAWLAYCTCGWCGNNPYPSRASAVSSLTYHYRSVGVAE